MVELNVIIASRDRACQLDLLLRSICEYVDGLEGVGLSVLYKASGSDYQRGYEKVMRLFPQFRFVDEGNGESGFRETLLGLARPDVPLMMFLVDDNVFKNPFSLRDAPVEEFISDPEIMCLSLRLGLHIDRCYTLGCAAPAPPSTIWEWRGMRGDWGYPMSMDGHLFRTHELLPRLESINFSNPNTLEARLAGVPLENRKMICYEESRVLNLPINRVQNVFHNRCGDVDPAALNAEYTSSGRRILIDPFRGVANRSPHQEFPIEFGESG